MRLPKLCGADIELGNFVLGLPPRDRRVRRRGYAGTRGTGREASIALLSQIEGVPGRALSARRRTPARLGARRLPGHAWSASESERTHLPQNGGCTYIDLDHLELCLPELLSAYDHVACWHAMLGIARDAQAAATAALPPGVSIQVLVNNSDGQGNSYGSHLDFLMTREAWDNLFHRKLHHLAYLAAYQASSIVFSGQGKVGSENGSPKVPYQLAQRVDFVETLVGQQTTFRRPLVNSRDEPLCGSPRASGNGTCPETAQPWRDMARLHVIFFDNTLCHVSSLLKVGVTQIILAMLEAGEIDPAWALDDPLWAIRCWSRDPSLESTAALVSGERHSAVELQLRFFEDARRFVEAGRCEGLVPRAAEILELWGDTLLKLEAKDFDALVGRLDWVLKLAILERVRSEQPGLGWDARRLKHLDHLYASLDPEEGLYWAFARDGLVEEVVTPEAVARFRSQPPEDTRAWGRAMWLRRLGPDVVTEVDWDIIRARLDGDGWRDSRRLRLDLSDPLGSTKRELEGVLEGDGDLDLETLLERGGAVEDVGRVGVGRRLPRPRRTWRRR